MTTVIGGPASAELAKKIAKRLDAKYIQAKLRVFPDGESKLTVEGTPHKGKIVVVQSTPPPVDTNMLHVFSLISKARKWSAQVIAAIPYLGYMRQDIEFLKRRNSHKPGGGKPVILLDDMISTGGSIVLAAKYLKKQNCGNLYAVCTHALLVDDAEKQIKRAGIKKIISTNTISGKTSLVDVSDVIAKSV
jgi:phosphoribosylpyrophosphate synthetase